jgi:hypothetical protein
MNNEEILRDLERAVIALEGVRREQRGEFAGSEVQNHIRDAFVAHMREKYGITAKTWSTK